MNTGSMPVSFIMARNASHSSGRILRRRHCCGGAPKIWIVSAPMAVARSNAVVSPPDEPTCAPTFMASLPFARVSCRGTGTDRPDGHVVTVFGLMPDPRCLASSAARLGKSTAPSTAATSASGVVQGGVVDDARLAACRDRPRRSRTPSTCSSWPRTFAAQAEQTQALDAQRGGRAVLAGADVLATVAFGSMSARRGRMRNIGGYV